MAAKKARASSTVGTERRFSRANSSAIGQALLRMRAAIDRLQGKLLLTSLGREQSNTWPALIVDLIEHRYAKSLHTMPSREEARTQLVRTLLDAANELSVADVTGALGWRKRDALAALESLGPPAYEETGVPIWSR